MFPVMRADLDKEEILSIYRGKIQVKKMMRFQWYEALWVPELTRINQRVPRFCYKIFNDFFHIWRKRSKNT